MDDDALLAALTDGTWTPEAFTHEARVRTCFVLARRFDPTEAARHWRRGLKHLFHVWGIRQTGESGYHETRDQAWLALVTSRARGFVGDSAAFVRDNPQLCDERHLERHYSPERLALTKGRRTRLDPDRRPLPKDYIASVDFPWEIVLRPIGIVQAPFTERHGTPRQGTIDAPRRSTVRLFEDVLPQRALADLEGFDIVWLLGWFHLNHGWNPTVRPPRGGERRSVLATRAPHRPNPIGLSAARLIEVGEHHLVVEGCDLLDGTPILDVKPYLPYADAFPDARAGWVDRLEEP